MLAIDELEGCEIGETQGGPRPLTTSASSLVSPRSGSADRPRAAWLRVPAGGEKQGRQTDLGRHPAHDDAVRLPVAKSGARPI